jgi:hypothetical protein
MLVLLRSAILRAKGRGRELLILGVGTRLALMG